MKEKKTEWRKTLGVEGEISRMVVNEEGYKYVRYDAVGIEERLMDLNKDPFETTHFTNEAAYADKLDDLKKVFENEWFPGF